MLDHKRLLMTATALALIGVLALFVYSATIEPEQVPLEELDEAHVGRVITTNGTIRRAGVLSDGSVSVEMFCADSSVKVYVPERAYASFEGNLTPGTLVEVTGEVMVYQEKLEISISEAEDIRVLALPRTTTFRLWTIMDSVEMFDRMPVCTNGTMVDITEIHGADGLVGSSFRIMDIRDNETYSLECIVFNRTLEQFEEFDEVIVSGTITFYKNKGSWQLIVDIIEKEYSQTLNF